MLFYLNSQNLRILFLLSACLLSAQAADSVRVVVADLKQDVSSLSQEVRALRLEVEQLRQENLAMRKALSSNALQGQITQLANSIQRLQNNYIQADESQKKVILSTVNRQIESLAEQMQTALQSVAKAASGQPTVETPVRFSGDYPQTGITYVVESGDTLSAIARTHGSTVKYIQNANKIVNPARDLRVGQSIFIPIKQP